MYTNGENKCTLISSNGYINQGKILTDDLIFRWQFGDFKIKPHLRRLEDITEEESDELLKLEPDPIGFRFAYLIYKGYDLFGLIDSSEAIDIKTIKQ